MLRLLEERKISLRSLAARIGVTPGALSKYGQGSVPSLEVAARIAETLEVSLDALVWASADEPVRPLCNAPEEHRLLHELVNEFGLEDLLELADLGTQTIAWEITRVLISCHPEAMPAQSIRQSLPDHDEKTFHSSLLALRKRQIVLEVSDGASDVRYRLWEPVADFSAREIGDLMQHGRRAVQFIFRDVLPALERRDPDAHLTSVSASVPLEVAKAMSRELYQTIREKGGQFSASTGDTAIQAVLAIAISDNPV